MAQRYSIALLIMWIQINRHAYSVRVPGGAICNLELDYALVLIPVVLLYHDP